MRNSFPGWSAAFRCCSDGQEEGTFAASIPPWGYLGRRPLGGKESNSLSGAIRYVIISSQNKKTIVL